jgi:transposase
MKILALDLGKFNTMCCLFDSKSRKHHFVNATTDSQHLGYSEEKPKNDLVDAQCLGCERLCSHFACHQSNRNISYDNQLRPS